MYKENEKVTVNRNYKDTVFRSLFREKRNCLELYNALNGSNYENEDELEIVTLENAIYLSQKNDLAFILDYRLHLYEHQSSYNPNMPLRDLFYISAEYQKLVEKFSLYASKAIKIPAPRFIVFYNGRENRPEKEILKLSDLYTIPEQDPMLELQVQVLNINAGNNEDIKNRCPVLHEYMIYVEQIRKYLDAGYSLQDAVEGAIDKCIKEGILREFLIANKGEVIAMSIFEYDAEEEMRKYKQAEKEYIWETTRKEAWEEAWNEGKREGRNEVKARLILMLKELHIPRESILLQLQKQFDMTEEEACEMLENVEKE